MAKLAVRLFLVKPFPKGDILGECRAGNRYQCGSRDDEILYPHIHAAKALPQRPNTNSMVWLRWSLSSGIIACLLSAMRLSPDRMAMYCLPFTSNVIGGALKPTPTLIFHSCSRVVSS